MAIKLNRKLGKWKTIQNATGFSKTMLRNAKQRVALGKPALAENTSKGGGAPSFLSLWIKNKIVEEQQLLRGLNFGRILFELMLEVCY